MIRKTFRRDYKKGEKFPKFVLDEWALINDGGWWTEYTLDSGKIVVLRDTSIVITIEEPTQ